MDFNSLVSVIIETTENDGSEFVGALPAMIQRAQEKMQNDLDDQGLVSYASVAVSGATAEVSVPVGGEIIKTFSIEVGGARTQLKHRPYEYLLDYWPVSASTGTPRYYGFKTNTQIRVAPHALCHGRFSDRVYCTGYNYYICKPYKLLHHSL